MANVVLPNALEAFLEAFLASSDIKVVLIDTGAYTYSAAHTFLSDVAVGARIATSGNLANKTFTDGVFDADDIVIPSVSGVSIEAFYVYRDTGVAGTSHLLSYTDTTSDSSLPFTPNGASWTITWPVTGVFRLQ